MVDATLQTGFGRGMLWMAKSENRKPLPLLKGLLRWGDPDLIEKVQARERRMTLHQMEGHHLPRLLPDADHLNPEELRWGSGGSFEALNAAWEQLEADFRTRILDGLVFLLGVQTEPELETVRRPIQSIWASDFHFDFDDSRLRVHQFRFSAVVVTDQEPPEVPRPPATAPTAAAPVNVATLVTPESIAELSPEQVAMLLEAHAHHVRDDLGIELLPPGKASIIALLAQKMRKRAEDGDLCPTMASEADWLEAWGRNAAPSHYCPQAKTIINKLAALYRALNKAT